MAAVDKLSTEEATVQRPKGAVWTAAFDTLCRWLSVAPPPTFASPLDEEPDWVALIEHANRELVVTNLYCAFASRGWPAAAPEDLREYLSLVYEANAVKNRLIRQQAVDIADTFAEAGVRYAFLKGANWLLEIDAGRIGERWLSDIDLVLSPDDWSKGLAALDSAGFRPVVEPALFARHFHHVPLFRPDDRVTVEIHRHLGWQRHLLTPQEVVAAALPLPGTPQVRLSNPAHRFVFGCLHAQLQNMQYAAGHFSLRDLCDIQYLASTQADRLDWARIAALARERGTYRYLAASLHLCHRTFGMALPPAFANSASARRHAARCFIQHRGRLRLRANVFAVKVAWLLDERRIAYELDCEKAPWPTRQLKIAGGRLSSILGAVLRRKRLPD